MTKKFLSFVVALFASTILFTLPSFVLADPTLDGLNSTAGKVTAYNTTINQSYSGFIQTKAGLIIGIVLSFVGVLFLGLMIYAGILWMTAQGNDTQVTKSKTLLINAIIGMVIVFGAYAITSFVGNNLLG